MSIKFKSKESSDYFFYLLTKAGLLSCKSGNNVRVFFPGISLKFTSVKRAEVFRKIFDALGLVKSYGPAKAYRKSSGYIIMLGLPERRLG